MKNRGNRMIFRWTKKLGVWGWISVVVGGFALTLVMVVVGSIYWQRSRVETMIARIRSAGEPVTLAEFEETLPAIPPERDATRLWFDGFAVNGPPDPARFAKLPFVGAEQPDESPLPGSPWPELALAEEVLADHAVALKVFHEAAELGGAARLNPMLDPRTLALKAPRAAVRLLLVESHVRAHKGEVEPTVASLHAALAIGKACEGSPFLMSFAVHQGIDASAIGQLLRLLPHVAFTDAQLARLQSTLRAIDHRRELLHALRGERVFAIRTLRNPALPGGRPFGVKHPFAYAMLSNAAMPDYLETMSEAVAAAKLRWPEALDETKEISRRQTEIPLYAGWGHMGTPAITPYFKIAAKAQARTRLADVALAAHRYRLANGRLPAALDELAPDFLPSVPLDPFNGEPLRYLSTNDGFVVYSVGVDRKDDGGRYDKAQPENFDLGYLIRYPRDATDVSTE